MFEKYKSVKSEVDKLREKLHQLDIEKARMDEERAGLLRGLGWTGLTDEEISWVCNHIKKHGQFLFRYDVEGIRKMIESGLIVKERLDITEDKNYKSI